MTGWRAKDMTLGEFAQFRDYFEKFYEGASLDKRLALFVGHAGHLKTALIPDHRAAMVELLSPGGWRDHPSAADDEWLLSVGNDSAFEEMGLRRQSVGV